MYKLEYSKTNNADALLNKARILGLKVNIISKWISTFDDGYVQLDKKRISNTTVVLTNIGIVIANVSILGYGNKFIHLKQRIGHGEQEWLITSNGVGCIIDIKVGGAFAIGKTKIETKSEEAYMEIKTDLAPKLGISREEIKNNSRMALSSLGTAAIVDMKGERIIKDITQELMDIGVLKIL